MKQKNKTMKQIFVWAFIVLALVLIVGNFTGKHETVVAYSDFKKQLYSQNVKSVVFYANYMIVSLFEKNEHIPIRFKTIQILDMELVKNLETYNVESYSSKPVRSWLPMLVQNFIYVLLFWLMFWLLLIRPMQSGGKQIFSFSQSKAKKKEKKGPPDVTFSNVAGCEEVKEELREVVDFLENPKKFHDIGAKIPKGILLYGSPGTGKTLLAKAVAGESKSHFFSCSGSEFVEMFVGVGASRVRDLFKKGRDNSPCILFIDEIDAVGRHRFSGLGGGHDEREQTLNQILVEMDGFDTMSGVIIIAATNRPDVLDPALLRPGRFDRQIVIPLPDVIGREAILDVHAKKLKMEKDIDLKPISRQTFGFTGADLANLINEAALLSVKCGRKEVSMYDLEESIEKVIAGPQRKTQVISDKERKIVAYHESGHALIAYMLSVDEPVHKVNLIPRGKALGYTLQLPIQDKFLASESDLRIKIKILLGGRTAEKLIFKDVTSGAYDDFMKATKIATQMVTQFGMSALGNISLQRGDDEIFLGRDIVSKSQNYSDKTAEKIDTEISKIIHECLFEAEDILTKNMDKLKNLAEILLKKEVLNSDDLKDILSPSQSDNDSEKNEKNSDLN